MRVLDLRLKCHGEQQRTRSLIQFVSLLPRSHLDFWDTSRATTMAGCFKGASKFNQRLLFDVSKVKGKYTAKWQY